MEIKATLEQFSDYLAPRLDTYEQVIYLYAFRHTRLQGLREAVIGFKSARRKMAMGIGEKGKPMSEHTCYEKLRSLEQKGCIAILDKERAGTRLQVNLPAEIPGLIPPAGQERSLSLEELDFFSVPAHRTAILRREQERCFYCLRSLNAKNWVVEHVESRPNGKNTYWNVVAACRSCNDRKGPMAAEDFLRSLYRDSLLTADDFTSRRGALDALRRRELKPTVSKG